ncbi:MAG: hypothetical protein JWN18_68 [Parcubacteria group bacterium]|nr:hypothetical protein [Parcubacteria group bacterium]
MEPFMSKSHISLITIGVLLFVTAGGYFAFNSATNHEKQGSADFEPYRATLSGTHVCLPHKDASASQTLECATGIQTDSGEYYALDFNLMSQSAHSLAIGQHFSASGVVTPIERLNSDHWQLYTMRGIFSVTDELQVESTTTVITPPVAKPVEKLGKCYVGGCSSQLCTDQPAMVSTCEYTDAYACYKTAVCERQKNGACGWTDSVELRSCLQNSTSNPAV